MDDTAAVQALVARMASEQAKASPEAAIAELNNLSEDLMTKFTAMEELKKTAGYAGGRIKFGDEFVHQGGGLAFMEIGVIWGLKDEKVAVAWMQALGALQKMAACWGDITDDGLGAVSLCLDLLMAHKTNVELVRQGLEILCEFGAGYDFTLTSMGSVGTCEVTVEMLRLHLEDAKVARWACQHLWSLVSKRQDSNRVICAALGAVELVVKALELYKLTAPETANMAVGALVSLTANYGWTKFALAEAGGLELLLEYLSLADDEHESENVYFALQNLSSVHAERLRDLGALELLKAKEDEEAEECVSRLELWLDFWSKARLPLFRPWVQRQCDGGYPIWINGETGYISEEHPALAKQPVPPLPAAHESLHSNASELEALRVPYSNDRLKLERAFAESRRALGEERRLVSTRGFWLGVLENHDFPNQLINEWDKEALMDLQDIACEFVDSTKPMTIAFDLCFVFAPNPFFTNSILKVRFIAPKLFADSSFYRNFSRDGTLVGTEIHWTQDLTVDPEAERGWNGRRYKRTEPRESFFDLFSSPKSRESMDFLFNVSEALRNFLIPDALSWFLGEEKSQLFTPSNVTKRPRSGVAAALLENETKHRRLSTEYEAARLALEIQHQVLSEARLKERSARIREGDAAIPGFWGAVIEAANLPLWQPSDKAALASLQDITMKWLPALPGKPNVTRYELGFHFAPNAYFTNDVLTLQVSAKDLFACICSPPECNLEACKVHYKRGKNLSSSPRGMLARWFRRARPLGFFDMFTISHKKIPDDALLVVAEIIRERIIPDALAFYLGTQDDPDQRDVVSTKPSWFIGSTAMVTFYDKEKARA
jgi:hypothetical protein